MSEHDKLLEDLEKLQDRCQRGISGRGEKLYYAVNDFCADVYGTTGAAAAAIRELQGIEADFENAADLLDKANARIAELEAQVQSLQNQWKRAFEGRGYRQG